MSRLRRTRLELRGAVTLVIVCTALAIGAAVLGHGTILFIPAVINAAISLAANSVCRAGRAAPERIPDWVIDVSVVTTALGASLLIAALVIR